MLTFKRAEALTAAARSLCPPRCHVPARGRRLPLRITHYVEDAGQGKHL
jgi:hypothetical protein